MNIRFGQAQLGSARIGLNDLQLHNFNQPLTGFGPKSRESWPATFKRRDRSRSGATDTVHLSQVLETILFAAVAEERNRMAREIHDTLAQEFAGNRKWHSSIYSTMRRNRFNQKSI